MNRFPTALKIEPGACYAVEIDRPITISEVAALQVEFHRESGARLVVIPDGGHLVRDADSIYVEIAAERARAHAKHGDRSMEAMPATNLYRLAILLEEVGEVAKVYNDTTPNTQVSITDLRAELIQVAAMAAAWADALTPATQ